MRLSGLLVLLLVGACGPMARSGGAPPQTAVRGWMDAVKHDDPRSAYALLASAIRKDMSYDQFAQRWREAKAERAVQAQALEAGLREDPQMGQHAKITLADGKTTSLVREADGWRLEVPLMDSLRASNPQDALRMLAAALEQRSFEGVMRVLTSTRSDAFKGKLDSFLGGLKAHIGTEIEISGERAFLRWSDPDGKVKWKVTLIRENGEWRVDDVTPQ